MFSPPQPVALVDTHLAAQPSFFLQHNFGCYGQSLSPWPIAGDLRQFLSPVIFVPEEIQANPRLVPRAEGDIVSSERELIRRIATQRNLIGLAQLSASFAPRLEIGDLPWSSTVNFVVGDSFSDRVIFWNAIHLTPAWLNGGIVALKVCQDDLEDADRFGEIVNIIKNRIHLPIGGSGSHAHIVVRSASLLLDELERIEKRLKTANGFNAYTSEHIDSLDALVPEGYAFERARYNSASGSPFEPQTLHEGTFAEDTFRPPIDLPRHLRDTPHLPASAKQGLWQLDLGIERTVDHSWVQNVQHRWWLPRRLRMAGAFARGYVIPGASPICMPRATASGSLSLSCGIEVPLPEITVPTDEAAFRYAICAGSDWLPFASRQERRRPGLALDMRPSDKGRYLRAVLRMAGDIHRAKGIFLSRFWKEQFECLGATPKATDERISTVIQRLRKRFGGGLISSEDEWRRLAKVAIKEAHAERFPARYLKFSDLVADFEVYRKAYWTRHPAAAPRGTWEEHEKLSLAASVKYLCQQEILHQGHEWRCRQCFHNNWVSIDDLKRRIVCEVCGRAEPAPVTDSWHFRLNRFILEGLREHGLLPTIWCLAKCAESAKASFFYLDPHELFFTRESVEAGKSDAELDLLVVSDGVVRLVEAKASERGINVAKSAELAKRLRPDMVTLAILEAPSPGLGAKLEELRRQLAGSDIAANVMTLDPDDVDDSPSLPPVHHTGCVCSDLLAGQEGGRRRQLQCIAGCSGGDKRLRLSPFAPSHSPPGMSPVCAKPTSAGLMPTGANRPETTNRLSFDPSAARLRIESTESAICD